MRDAASLKVVLQALGLIVVASGLASCVSLGDDVLELCESHINTTPPVEIVAADVKNRCGGEPQPVLCARASVRELRAASLSAASSLDEMADYYLDMAWGVEPSVAHGLRTRCPLAREHLLEMVNGLDALLREIDNPAFWEPEDEVPHDTDATQARLGTGPQEGRAVG